MKTIPEIFLTIAEQYSSKIAVKYKHGDQWRSKTYADIEREAKAIAAYLQGQGIGCGDPVVLPSLRSPSMCSALLGILLIGGYYVFIDPRYPKERKNFIAQEVGAKIGLYELEQSAIEDIDILWHTLPIDTIGQVERTNHVDADMPACVFFTSGSTGTPKGVVVPHRGIVRLVVDTDYISFSASEVFLQLSTPSFDAATLEIWGALLNGGTCVLHFEQDIITPAGIKESIQTQQVTTTWLTSSLFNALISEHHQVLKPIKQLLTGGEALSVAHVRKGLQLLPQTQLYNGYGPTENTTFTTVYPIPRTLPPETKRIPIGFPIHGTSCELFDEHLQPIHAQDQPGELIAFGQGVALGYLNRAELTDERFVDIVCADGVRRRGYRTGDLVRKNADGSYDFLQRNDKQVKIDGHRIEPGEIELFLNELAEVDEARVVVRVGPAGQKRLAAYMVGKATLDKNSVREKLRDHFPPYMVPHFLILLPMLPINQNGKLDESQLPDPFVNVTILRHGHQTVAALWKEVLGRSVDPDENFLDAGGTSLEALRLAELIEKTFSVELQATFAFEYTTINQQADFLVRSPEAKAYEEVCSSAPIGKKQEFAVIGMACRLPGADTVAAFWDNLLQGRESITFFSEDELRDTVEASILRHPRYVKAKGLLNNYDTFDAGFFGVSPTEADVMDPQQRIALELCWHALEDAGIPPGDQSRRTGVFLGMNWARYYQQYVLPNKDLLEKYGVFNSALANETDFLATRVSYKLNLHGPSVNVFTACSTGLVAVAQACAAIEQGQCEQAIAGGVSLSTPVQSGYLYQEGNMLSQDGHCRPFDAQASGTTFNDGAGAVVVKRRDLAEQDGDRIYAIIKGYAVNNDGEQKASYTAPSMGGQVRVYDAALQHAGVDPASVGFIETHGTATPLGDPIEVQALSRSYARPGSTEKRCALGSVKSNIGHTIHAAGVASLIKTVLAVQHDAIPPTLFFQAANPKIGLEATPFFVNNKVISWPGPSPRRAAVSSLGVGGTNAHLVVEEYPQQTPPPAGHQVEHGNAPAAYPVVLSAKTPEALQRQIAAYCRYLEEEQPQVALGDVAYTAAVGRKHFAHRAVAYGRSLAEILRQCKEPKGLTRGSSHGQPHGKVGFLFSGQGAQRVGMGRWLYEHDGEYRRLFDRGCELILASEEFDLRPLLFADNRSRQHELDLQQTNVAQPAIFLLEYGLAKSLQSRGCSPDFFIGHSIGEFTAAALAGVFTFEDAVTVIAKRGALMQAAAPGHMLVVQSDLATVRSYLDGQLDLAAINGPNQVVLAGSIERIQEVSLEMKGAGIASVILRTSHAFHSSMMDSLVEPFADIVAQAALAAPQVPIYSTKTGALLRAEEAVSPRYWASQLRSPVLFSEAVVAASREQAGCALAYVEIGPGSTLTSLVSAHQQEGVLAVAALPGGGVDAKAENELGACVNKLWVAGFPIHWQTMFSSLQVKKIGLPGYAFARDIHWLKRPGDSEMRESKQVVTCLHNDTIDVLSKIQGGVMNNDRHKAGVEQQLRAILEDITGYDLADMEGSAHFSEAGLDSLLLTQAATAIDRHFDIGVTFRHLVEDYTCLDDLCAFVAEKVPMTQQDETPPPNIQEVVVPSLPKSGPLPLPATIPSTGNALHDLVNTQLQIMQMQLQVLGGCRPAADFALPQPGLIEAAPAPVMGPGTPGVKEGPAEPEPGPSKPRHTPGTRITREIKGVQLTTAQKEWIDDLLQRYQAKFSGSKNWTQKHRRNLADPRTVSGFNPEWKEIIFPIVTVQSKGSKLRDIDGNELIDTSNGFGPIFFGHSPDFITAAVKEQLDRGIETGPQSPLAGEVADLFCELTGNERCTFACSGSEAVIGALRLARTVTGRSKVVMFEGSYHGIFDEVICRPGKAYQALPAAPGISRESTSNMLVLPWGEEESLAEIRRQGKELAAVLVESVQSRKPAFHSPEYIKALREITEENGTALILDEVVTGFRVHPGGIRKRFAIDADLATYGKVVGGGYPIGIIGGKAKFMDALDGGYWQYGDASIPESGVTFFAGTFVRHPLSLAAAKAVLTRIKQEGMALYEGLEAKTAKMAAEAKAFIAEMRCEVTFEEFASFFYIAAPASAHWGHLLFVMMTLEGIHIQQYRPNFLTTEHSAADVEKILSAFKSSLAQLILQGLIEGDQVAAKKSLAKTSALPPGARLGKNAQGEPAYFIEDPQHAGKYIEVGRP